MAKAAAPLNNFITSSHAPAQLMMDFLPASNSFSEVSKACRDLIYRRMQRIAFEILQRDRPFTDKINAEKRFLFPPVDVATVAEEAHAAPPPRLPRQTLEDLRATATEKMPPIELALQEFQERLSVLQMWSTKAHAFAQNTLGNGAIDRQMVFFHKFNAHLDEWHAQFIPPDPPAVVDPAEQLTQSYEKAIALLKRFVIDESLTRRFQAIIQPELEGKPGFNIENSTQMPECLKVLVKSQRQELSESMRAKFDEYTLARENDFSLARFRTAEEITLHEQFEADLHLNRLWQQILNRLNLDVDPTRTASERRIWMNNAANAAFDRIDSLSLRGFRQLPSEIGRLRKLNTLECIGSEQGRLTDLPDALANLTELSTVFLFSNNFARIPAQLERFPAGFILAIASNKSPITTFPETIARQYANSFWMHLFDALWGMGGGVMQRAFGEVEGGVPSTLHYLGLHPEVMTDIPFCMWFRDYFSIPYIHVGFPLLGIVYALAHAAEFIAENCWMPLAILGIGLVVAVGIATLALALLLNLPIFLLNLGIHWGLEPIVSAFRSCLGYAPMMHFDPPAPVPA